jgi:gamma-glutamyl:cysteine ligase YbdK (ATP-grasp superfamily)
VAQAALDHDEGVPFDDPAAALIEENFWRAIRYGLDGKLIDSTAAEEYPAAAVARPPARVDRARRGGARHRSGLPEENGAQRQQRCSQGRDDRGRYRRRGRADAAHLRAPRR